MTKDFKNVTGEKFNQREFFSQIYDQYVGKIYRFVFLKVNSQEAAEDLTSETFVRGWRAFQKTSEKGGGKKIENISAFLYQIARNLVTDFYRRNQRYKIVPADTANFIETGDSAIETADLGMEMTVVRKALLSLKDNYQDLIIWHYLDDLQVPEIANMLGQSEGTVRVRLSRALEALREQIATSDYPIEL